MVSVQSRLHMKKYHIYIYINIHIFTFLTHPNFLVLFRTGSDNQPSNRDSENKRNIKEHNYSQNNIFEITVHLKIVIEDQ